MKKKINKSFNQAPANVIIKTHKIDHISLDKKIIDDYKLRFFLSVAMTLPLLLMLPSVQSFLHINSILYFKGNIYALFFLSSIIFFGGGWPFLKGIVREVKQNTPGTMTLVAISTTVAYLYSLLSVFGLSEKMFFGELAILIDLMLFGHWVEVGAMSSTNHSLEELKKLLPESAHKIISAQKTKDVPIDSLQVKDVILVKPGEKIPADGKIIKGSTTIDEFLLTRETGLVNKTINNYVIGGSFNGQGTIEVEITQIGENSFIYQVMRLISQAQNSKLQIKDFANTAAYWLTIISLLGSTLTLFLWIFFSDNSFSFALERALTVMVIACPHALSLAIPLVVAISASRASTNGLIIRNWTAFEKAKDVKSILFDKTDTLIKSKFGVTDVVVLDKSFDDRMILCYASAVERNSEHPIAQAIFKSVCEITDVQNFKILPNEGVEGDVEGRHVKVVNQKYLKELNKEVTNKELTKFFEEGKTIVFVMVDDEVIGAIAMSDTLKDDSIEVIKKLKKMGIKTVITTEDSEKYANYIAKKLGAEDYFFEVTQEQKVKKVEKMQDTGLSVAVVGNGIKDASSLATANIGIAIGAGIDIGTEIADVVLVRDNLSDISSVFKLSKASYRKMKQNLILVIGYNVFMVPVAVGLLSSANITVSPAIGAVFVSLGTVLVALNAKLLKV